MTTKNQQQIATDLGKKLRFDLTKAVNHFVTMADAVGVDENLAMSTICTHLLDVAVAFAAIMAEAELDFIQRSVAQLYAANRSSFDDYLKKEGVA